MGGLLNLKRGRGLRRYVRDFDGVFSADTLPEKPRLLVCNTDASDVYYDLVTLSV